MGLVDITDVKYIVDENLLSLGNGMVAVRHDTARFSRPPVEDLLPGVSPTPTGYPPSATADGS